MSDGRLIAIVGPSGVGKDSVMAGLLEAVPGLSLVQRVITRPADPGGEPHRPATEAEFDRMSAAGAFCLEWRAHGLRYGIPVELVQELRAGHPRLINLSRAILPEAQRVFPGLDVVLITASADVLAARLRARGRESEAEIARRLQRAAAPLPAGVTAIAVSNDGPLDETIAEVRRRLDL